MYEDPNIIEPHEAFERWDAARRAGKLHETCATCGEFREHPESGIGWCVELHDYVDGNSPAADCDMWTSAP